MDLPLISEVIPAKTGLVIRTDKSSISMVPVTLDEPPEAKFTRSFTAPAGTRRRGDSPQPARALATHIEISAAPHLRVSGIGEREAQAHITVHDVVELEPLQVKHVVLRHSRQGKKAIPLTVSALVSIR